MSLAMTKAEREGFLAGTRVAIIGIAEDGRGPLAVPVWYEFVPPNEIRILTGGHSKKVDLLRKAGRMSLCVQTETPPYQHVSVEGPVRIQSGLDTTELARSMAIRYLGEQLGAAYIELTKGEREDNVLVTLSIERWITVDYNRMV